MDRFRSVFRREPSLLSPSSMSSSDAGTARSNSKGEIGEDSGSFAVIFNDDAANTAQNFPTNFIKTSRYNPLTFLPLNLYQQFHRFANCYFLACIIIQIIPGVTPFPIYTTVIPLVVILAVSAIKDGVEDYQRHRLDYIANNRMFSLVRNYAAKSSGGSVELTDVNGNGSGPRSPPTRSRSMRRGGSKRGDDSENWLTPVSSKDIHVGNILKIRNGEEFPADLVLLSTSNHDATAYVNTANLDGEAVPKVRVPPQCTLHANKPEGLLSLQGRIKAEAANANLYQFQGRIELDAESAPLSPRSKKMADNEQKSPIKRGQSTSEIHINEQGDEIIVQTPSKQTRAANIDKSGRMLFPVGDQQLMLRGSRLVNTEYIYGMVVYTGYQTKMMLNRNAPRIKESYFEHKLNQFVFAVFVFNFFVCLLLSITFAARDQSWASVYHVDYPGGVGWLLNFLTQYILLSFMIPISLYVTIELVRVGQVFFMQWDRRMYYRDPTSHEWRRCQVKSSSLNEELGCIEYIFSDKTGTLTQNKMELSAMSVDGQIYFERTAAEIALEEAKLHGEENEVDGAAYDGETPAMPARPGAESKDYDDDEPMSPTTMKHSMVSDVVALAMTKHHQQSEEKSSENDGSNNIELEFLANILTCNSVMPSKKAIKARSETTESEAKGDKKDKAKAANTNQEIATELEPETQDLDSLDAEPLDEDDSNGTAASTGAKAKVRWQFQSQSPDEMALCETCNRHGLTMAARKGNTVTIKYAPPATVKDRDLVPVSMVYTIMATLDFTSTRARMSVVVRTPDDNYRLYIKGADSAVYKRLEKEELTKDDSGEPSSLQAKTAKHVETFAGSGSRTLCYAYRPLSRQEFNHWEKTYQQAVNALEDREALVELAFEEIEHSMRLLGCTGVEDQLQEYVPEAIDYMIKAGVKVIVLTGDKKETAVTIAKQSNLIPADFALFYMQGITKDLAKQSLDAALKEMNQLKNDEIANGTKKPFALAIDGLCMELCLKYFREEFIAMFVSCSTIVSYRSTPRQKALCVGMAKVDLSASVLAIGDGANDVSMIQEAKVGVGILGKEGAHAAMSADYVIHRFYHLIFLIFIQGRYNFYRTSKVCYYSFYKNMMYSFPQIYYSFYSLNTGQTLYIAVFQSTFNLLFTSLPPLFAGWYEKDLPDALVLNHPQTFRLFKDESIFNFPHFFRWMLSAIYHGTVLYFFMHFAVVGDWDASGEISQDGRPVYLWLMGTLILFAIVLLTNLKFITTLDYITWISVGVSLIGIFLFLIVMILFGARFFYSFAPECYQILAHVFGTNLTWSYMGLVIGLCYIPTLLTYAMRTLYFPSTAQKLKVWYWSGGGSKYDADHSNVFAKI